MYSFWRTLLFILFPIYYTFPHVWDSAKGKLSWRYISLCLVILYLSDLYDFLSALCIDMPLLNTPGKGINYRNSPTTHSADLSSMVIQMHKGRGFITIWMSLMVLVLITCSTGEQIIFEMYGLKSLFVENSFNHSLIYKMIWRIFGCH
jgi:hypothetical protein